MNKIEQIIRKMCRGFLKCISLLDEIGRDRFLCCVSGAVITGCMIFFPKIAPYGWIAGALAGGLKMCIDRARGNAWEAGNFMAMLAGSSASQIFLWLYLLIL